MPNINNSIIDFNDFNAEPQLLRDIQDGKAIAFYSFAHLLLDTSGKPYTLPTGLYISGAYDTLQQLQSSFPTGNTNLYIVNADKYIYYWNGSAWTKGGTIDATYAFGVELQVPNTATNGTLTQEQFNQLSNNENAYILFNNERYLLMDKGHEVDTWGYSHLGADITGAKIKVITINTSNRSWVLTDEEFVKDGTISTQKIQDGAVTTQKLGSDVSLQIRKNDFASRFNSDRLNILEAQINADKNTIEYTSDKALEVTCNGANIIDCNAHFKKVEGQTRRYSLNLWEYSGLSDAHGVDLKVEGQDIIVTNNNTEKITWCGLINKHSLKAGTYTMGCYIKGEGSIYIVNSKGNEEISARIHGENELVITSFTIDKEEPSIKFRTDLYGKSSQTTFTNLFIYKGTLSKEELPPFQPYDNTLVNSKANFVSIGRNLFKYNGQYATGSCGLKYDGSNFVVTSGSAGDYWCQVHNGIKLPKGAYHFGCNVINGTGTMYIINSKGRKELSSRYTATGQIKGTFTTNEDEESIRFRISPSTINASATFTDLFITKADTGYEPDIKSTSQYDIELGAYDYIENGNLIKQTSEMVTLNGSEYWQIEGSSPTKRFLTYDKVPDLIFDNAAINVITNSSLTSVSAVSTWNNKIDSISGSHNTLHIASTSITTVEQLKEWLAKNPITLVCKKSAPTITPIVVPNGIVSYKNGLTSQEIKGKYLPYKYTAKYVNGGAE